MNRSTEPYSKSSASLLEEKTSIQLVPFQKVWIMDETVAAVQAGVWNALSHDASCGEAHSVPNLLAIHTIVMFLDELGGHVTTWLDDNTRKEGQPGR